MEASAVTDRWGPRGYGAVNGVLTAPSLVAAASAPFVGAALATLLGSWTSAFLVLACFAGCAALLVVGAGPRRVDG